MPISFSACCSMSFVTRNGAGVGDGEGRGVGLGDGPCARADARFRCGAANAAAPKAGTSFTNARRLTVLPSETANGFRTRFSFRSNLFIDALLLNFWSAVTCHRFGPGRLDARFFQ